MRNESTRSNPDRIVVGSEGSDDSPTPENVAEVQPVWGSEISAASSSKPHFLLLTRAALSPSQLKFHNATAIFSDHCLSTLCVEGCIRTPPCDGPPIDCTRHQSRDVVDSVAIPGCCIAAFVLPFHPAFSTLLPYLSEAITRRFSPHNSSRSLRIVLRNP